MRRSMVSLGALCLTAGCAETPEPFQDPEFDLFLVLEDHPPPCDCLKHVTRFGGVIRFDEESGLWLNEDGKQVDLSDRANTESPFYLGDAIVKLDPDTSFQGIARAFAKLGAAGICRFGRIALDGIETQAQTDPDGISLYDSYDSEIVLPTRLYAHRAADGTQMVCNNNEAPASAKTGFSRDASIYNR